MVCLLFHLLCNEYYQNPQFPAILCKIFVLRLVHILRNFRSINILYIHSINTSNLFPYKKSTAKPFPEPGGRGGGGRKGVLTMKAYTWGSARQGDLFQVSYKYMKG